jgi:hypothetical protein
MAGMRRRLRGITTRVSGALAVPRDEGAPPTAEAGVSETGGVPVVTEPTAETPTAAAAAADAACAAAVDLARAVAVEAGGTTVGGHLGVEADEPLVATHLFATTDPAYTGWRWAVTVARAEGSDEVTVDEVVLLPGSGALLAPAWLPWSERVRPGDLAPGDLLPPAPDDPRVVPAYADPEAELAAETFWELGLGRPRVLSREGLELAAERWYDGDHGPDTPMARQAPGQCVDCAFRVTMTGSLGAAFGVCANAQSPSDGTVVSFDHGCGAHSETAVDLTPTSGSGMVVEDEELELVPSGPSPEDETPDGHAS